MNVTVIGTGYVGLTTGVALAYLGHNLTGVDKDARKIDLLCHGKSPIYEPGLEELMGQVRSRLSFTMNTIAAVSNADLIMIAVGTPQKENGEANTRYVEEAAREVAMGLQPGRSYTLVIKSTVPIGTNRRVALVVEKALKERDVSARVVLGSNPEFLREGMALRDMFYPDRIVVGAEDALAVETLRRLYRPILEQTFDAPAFLPRPEGYGLPPLITTDPTSAEMIKYASNAFLAVKISFINEVAGLCDKIGADVTEVSRGIGLDSRIGPRFLNAGLGWGGSCFPKDTAALLAVAAQYGYTMPIVEAAREVNARQRIMVVEKLQTVLRVLRGRTIGVLGLAFKPNTDDIRESPAVELVRLLAAQGAHVCVHDPVAMARAREALSDLEVEYAVGPYEVANNADAVILATEWEVYRSLDLSKIARRMRGRYLVDARNAYSPEEAQVAGLVYLGVGR